jgi:hypothetical protein
LTGCDMRSSISGRGGDASGSEAELRGLKGALLGWSTHRERPKRTCYETKRVRSESESPDPKKEKPRAAAREAVGSADRARLVVLEQRPKRPTPRKDPKGPKEESGLVSVTTCHTGRKKDVSRGGQSSQSHESGCVGGRPGRDFHSFSTGYPQVEKLWITLCISCG